jgi:two-component system response regulator DevR
MSINKAIKLLLVDDHEVVRAGLRTVLAKATDISIVGEAGSVQEAIAKSSKLNPDVVMIDVRLPDGSGLNACRKIRDESSDTHVLVLTSFIDDNLVVEAIDAGASGYLLKEINRDGLVSAIRSVAAGISIFDPAVSRKALSNVALGNVVDLKSKLATLSAQEKSVLSLVALGKTNKEVAMELDLSDKTVRNYLSNLMSKLNVNRRSHAVAIYVQHSMK